jgi:hypothetical protein
LPSRENNIFFQGSGERNSKLLKRVIFNLPMYSKELFHEIGSGHA